MDEDPAEKDSYLTQVEVAAMLRIAVSTLAKWRQFGKPPEPSHRLSGTVYLYRRADVERFLAERTRGSRLVKAVVGTR